MRIHIRYVGYLNLKNAKNNSWIEIPEASTISQFLSDQSISEIHKKYITPSVNGKVESQSSVLKDGDMLFLYLPVGGG